MGIRVPPHLLALGKTVALQSWVDSRKFPRDKYFETIDGFRSDLSKYCNVDEVDNSVLVTMIAATVEAEGALVGHVIENKGDISDEEAWTNFLKAAAWLIYQRYTREVENGKWAVTNG